WCGASIGRKTACGFIACWSPGSNTSRAMDGTPMSISRSLWFSEGDRGHAREPEAMGKTQRGSRPPQEPAFSGRCPQTGYFEEGFRCSAKRVRGENNI